jgi:glycosyltransferase involved in cell wall biosynthesis
LVHAAWPEATLRIVGSGEPEGVAPGISSLPRVLLEPRWVPDSEMAPLIASSRCLVLPYREASQSGVLPLALAHGVPVIATSVGGLAAQLADGKSGFVVRPDPTALAAAMLRLREPTCYARLAQGAQAAGELLSDWSEHAEALSEGIAKVVAR